MRRASAPATLARSKKPPAPPPAATWALRRASKAITRQTADLAQALVVREVLAECVEDVAQAHHENEVNELKDLVDDQSLRLEVLAGERDAALRKIKQLEDERASIQQECKEARDAFCEDIVAWKRQQLQAEEERARHDRNAEDARRVPSLERRIGELERDLQRASRRLELFSNAGKPAQNGHTEKRPPLTILEDRVVLRVFSFFVAPEVLATAQSERRFFGRVDRLFSLNSAIGRKLRTTASPQKSVGLSSQIASAIASKLSPSEIKGIIALDRRCKALDVEVRGLQAEAEDSRAALEGAERVKEFLASKVRDAEESLAEALRSTESTRQQAGADQEVIAFLDERVRCLENEVAEATRARLELENSLGRDRDAAVDQLAAAQDAMRVDAERRDRQQASQQKARKLLVKEVKTLRSQLDMVRRAAQARV